MKTKDIRVKTTPDDQVARAEIKLSAARLNFTGLFTSYLIQLSSSHWRRGTPSKPTLQTLAMISNKSVLKKGDASKTCNPRICAEAENGTPIWWACCGKSTDGIGNSILGAHVCVFQKHFHV